MVVKLYLRGIEYCNSCVVGWDNFGQNLKLAQKRPSEITATKSVARQGSIVVYEHTQHTATQNLCVLQMRNISRFLISLLRFIYPIKRNSCS
jgi:hypothetical protein